MALNANQNLEPRPSDSPNWRALLSKAIDDLSIIAKTEGELLEATLKRLLEAQTDRIAGMAFLLVATHLRITTYTWGCRSPDSPPVGMVAVVSDHGVRHRYSWHSIPDEHDTIG
jgi:hypothetical protein